MSGARVTVGAGVLASAIRVDARVEADVGALVARDDRARRVAAAGRCADRGPPPRPGRGARLAREGGVVAQLLEAALAGCSRCRGLGGPWAKVKRKYAPEGNLAAWRRSALEPAPQLRHCALGQLAASRSKRSSAWRTRARRGRHRVRLEEGRDVAARGARAERGRAPRSGATRASAAGGAASFGQRRLHELPGRARARRGLPSRRTSRKATSWVGTRVGERERERALDERRVAEVAEREQEAAALLRRARGLGGGEEARRSARRRRARAPSATTGSARFGSSERAVREVALEARRARSPAPRGHSATSPTQAEQRGAAQARVVVLVARRRPSRARSEGGPEAPRRSSARSARRASGPASRPRRSIAEGERAAQRGQHVGVGLVAEGDARDRGSSRGARGRRAPRPLVARRGPCARRRASVGAARRERARARRGRAAGGRSRPRRRCRRRSAALAAPRHAPLAARRQQAAARAARRAARSAERGRPTGSASAPSPPPRGAARGSARKRSCRKRERRASRPAARASASSSGKPGCSIQARTIGSTVAPDASASARQRSAATALPSRWRADVRAHAGAERLGAEVALEHAHHRRALLVGDQVEVLGGLARRAHLGVDRMRVARARRGRSAAARWCSKSCHIFHSGFHSSTIWNAIQVANASFSQRSSHQAIVTRSPYHMCASSWQITSATRFFSGERRASAGRRSSSVSRKNTAPAFSIAPASKSGTATRSSLA